MPDPHALWSEDPAAALVAAERAWFEARRVQWPQATEVWIHPDCVTPQSGCVSLALDASGRLEGAMRARADLLPFADDSVPRVVLQHALDLRPAPRALLGEAVRVLAPGGILAVFGFDALSPALWRCRIAQRGRWRSVGAQFPGRLAVLGAHLGLADIHRFGFVPAPDHGTTVREGGFPAPAFGLIARKLSRNVIALRRTARDSAPAVGGLVPSASRQVASLRR